LGLLGGGGSILAVPLLIYFVGIADAHVAVGTSAVAVAASALINLLLHARSGTVKWPCSLAFAASGVLGALAGAELGQAVSGQKLLAAFSVAMVGVGISMLRRPAGAGDADVRIDMRITMRLVPTGLITGLASGFFGIGGGFLIVPGLMGAANMTMMNAVGSSLVAVTAFAAAGAASYAKAGLVDWQVAVSFIGGGLIGGLAAQPLGRRLASRKALLTRIFAVLIFCVAAYVMARSFR
ncbi:MAG: sulfite exporter TauE/SafE family protein, partial [Rhodospirillaceae bacterium]